MSFPSGHACAAFAGFGFLALWLNAKFKVFGRGRRSGFPDKYPDPDLNDSNSAAATVQEKQQQAPQQAPQNANANAGENTVGQWAGGRDEGRGRIPHWKLVLFVTPWCIATLLAGSKIRDG